MTAGTLPSDVARAVTSHAVVECCHKQTTTRRARVRVKVQLPTTMRREQLLVPLFRFMRDFNKSLSHLSAPSPGAANTTEAVVIMVVVVVVVEAEWRSVLGLQTSGYKHKGRRCLRLRNCS